MSITLEYDRDSGFLNITVVGQFVLEELDSAFAEITSSDEYPPNVDAIWDLRNANFTAADENLWRKIIDCRTRYTRRANCKSAMLVSGDLPYGMGRMYEILAEEDVPQELFICRTIEEAQQYLVQNHPGKE